jgi:hypothetical protein
MAAAPSAPPALKSDETIFAEIASRRAAVIEALASGSCPDIKDSQFCAQQLARSEDRVHCTLYDNGRRDPTKTTWANVVAWYVELDLWERLGPGSQFPYHDARPAERYGPACTTFQAYQRERLANSAAGASRAPTPSSNNNAAARQRVTTGPQATTAPEGVVDTDTLYRRLEQLAATTLPDNTAAWPRIIWEAMRQGPPPQGGDFFSLPLTAACQPLALPATVSRANWAVMHQIRIIIDPPFAPRGPRQLAVIFSPSGDPNSAPQLAYFLRVWAVVELWHGQVVSGVTTDPLDWFVGRVMMRGDMEFCVRMAERRAGLGN